MSTRRVCTLTAQRWTAFNISLPWRHIVQGVPLHYTLLECLSLCDVCALRCGVECGSSRRSTRCKKKGVQVLGHEIWWAASCVPLIWRWTNSPESAVTTYMTKKTRNDQLSSPSSPFANLITIRSEASGLRTGLLKLWSLILWLFKDAVSIQDLPMSI
jgi:hypothetical protein